MNRLFKKAHKNAIEETNNPTNTYSSLNTDL